MSRSKSVGGIHRQRAWNPLLRACVMLVLPMLAGCAGSDAFIQPNVDFSHIHRCAVLPYQNLTSDGFADRRLQSIFLMEVLREGSLEIVDPEETVSAMRAAQLAPGTLPTPAQVVTLGKALSVDAVFLGSVEEYGLQSLSHRQMYGVTAAFSMAETETGSLIWRSQVHVDGSSFWRRLFGGDSESLYDVSRKAVRKALGSLL
jgi:hypothetical protein